MIKSYGDEVTTLRPNEVFIFGSNLQGFHGAGAAGFASFGRPGNIWRAERYSEKPDGWKGKWNVKGRGEGFQQGTEGSSYALPTVARAGAKRSRTPSEIVVSIKKLYEFAAQNPDKKFLVAGSMSGTPLNGYTPEEMVDMYAQAKPIPDNVVFSTSYATQIEIELAG